MVVAAVVSVVGVFFDTAHTSILPALVGGPKSIAEANARLQTSDTTMRVVGPGVGGQLLRVTAGPLLYFATAAMSPLSVALLTRMTLDEHIASRRSRGVLVIVENRNQVHPPASGAANVHVRQRRDQLRYRHHDGRAAGVRLPDLSTAPAVYGLAISIGAVGGIIGSLIGMRVRAWLGELPSMRCSQTLLPIAALALVSATFVPRPAAPYLLGADEFLFGMALVINTICSTGIRARLTPLALMGRISAASRFVSIGAAPLGALLGGWLGTIIGHPAALACAAALMACGPIITKLSPVGRLRTVPAEWEAEDAGPLMT